MKFQLPNGVALVPFKAGLAATGLGSILGAVCLAIAGFSGQPTTVGFFVEAVLALSLYGFVFALPVVFPTPGVRLSYPAFSGRFRLAPRYSCSTCSGVR